MQFLKASISTRLNPSISRGLEKVWLSCENLVDFTGYFGKLQASYKQVDVLVDMLDKQLIFQLIYPIES